MMENAEEMYHFLEDFSKRKPKVIPQELNDYLCYVARTGDPVFQWPMVKSLFKEKLLNVITEFHETTPGLEIPPCPNVDPFNYDTMKNSLLERLDTFNSAPFTVQRICELLTFPRKQYNRIDKFMRAIEKNILVVSTREPGIQRPAELDNGEVEPMVEPLVNGDNDYSVDVDMQINQWKDAQNHVSEPQPSSSDTHISVDDLEARLQDKGSVDVQEKPMEYESVTPPEIHVVLEESEMKEEVPLPISADVEPIKEAEPDPSEPLTDPLEPDSDPKVDIEMKPEAEKSANLKELAVIPEIKVDDVEMTDKRLMEEKQEQCRVEALSSAEASGTGALSSAEENITEASSSAQGSSTEALNSAEASSTEALNCAEASSTEALNCAEASSTEALNCAEPSITDALNSTVDEPASQETVNVTEKEKTVATVPDIPESMEETIPTDPTISDESSSDSNTKEEPTKLPISTSSEVSSSEESSSSSSDHTEGNSNSPKPEQTADVNITDQLTEPIADESKVEVDEKVKHVSETEKDEQSVSPKDTEVPSTESEKVDETIDVTIASDEPKETLMTFESDNYSVADVKSELQQPESPKVEEKPEELALETPEVKVGVLIDIDDKVEIPEKPVENIGDAEIKET